VPVAVFQIFKVVVSVVIPFASVLTGLRTATVDPFWLLKRPSLLLRSLLAILVLVPLGTVAFLEVVRASALVETGLIVAILAVGIGPPAVLKDTRAAEANVGFEVELNVILMAIAVAFVPTAVALIGRYFRLELRLEAWRVAGVVLTRAVLPLFVGVLIARLLPRVAAPMGRVGAQIVQIVLLAVVALALLVSWRGLLELGAQGWLTSSAVALGALVVGHLCGGPDPANRRVLATFSSIRFPGLALLIASIAPLAKGVMPVVLAYVISSVVLVAIYMAVTSHRRRPPRLVVYAGSVRIASGNPVVHASERASQCMVSLAVTGHGAATGIEKKNVLPWPGELSTQIRPP
jgi:BASS family bile acid:Na+ symporter